MTKPKRLAIIDGKSVYYRGYYSMPGLTAKDGTPTGGVFGFMSLAIELIKQLKPDYVAVAWDKPKTNIRKRREIYPDYKAGRKPAPADFYEQIPTLHALLEALSWPLYEYDDYEADDIMATLAKKAEDAGIETCLITSDLDALQSVSDLTHVYALKKGFTDIDLYKPADFEAKYGLRVEQFLDLKSLKGDSSDNIPGVPGVGEKTAVQLLQEYDTLDEIYANLDEIKETTRKKLVAGRESAYMSKQIAELWLDAPVPLDLEAMDVHDVGYAHLKKILTELEFTSLVRRLGTTFEPLAKEDEPIKPDYEPLAILPFDDAAKTSIIMAEHVVTACDGEQWFVSSDERTGYRLTADQAAEVLSSQSLITHHAKEVLRLLLESGIDQLPTVAHDTRIAHFLLDSLDRARSLEDISGQSLADDDGGLRLAIIWNLYNQQTTKLADLPKMQGLARDVEFPVIEVLARMEFYGVQLDNKVLDDMSVLFAEKIAEVESQVYEHAGYEFNIASPSQLADVLFTKLQLPTTGIKKGKTGYSTGAKELDKLRAQHPIINLITAYREYTKLKSTYIDALPKLVDKSGRLHTTFNMDVAATGRLSSTDPNLQNIPIRTELGRKIREAFVPGDGNVFVSADYSQFELRLAAVLAGDTQLISDFNGDLDIHTKTASDVYGVPLDQVTKAQRRDAKVINFGVLYGMSPHGLSAATGMSFGDAKKFIDEYFRLRAPIKQYIDDLLEQAKLEGFVETLFGRRRPTPDVNSSNFIVREAAKRAAANMPIQGTEADLMKMAMIEVDNKLRESGTKEAPLGMQVLQIHDSILIECPKENAEEVSAMLVQVMENIYPDLGVKLRVDASTGDNWGQV